MNVVVKWQVWENERQCAVAGKEQSVAHNQPRSEHNGGACVQGQAVVVNRGANVIAGSSPGNKYGRRKRTGEMLGCGGSNVGERHATALQNVSQSE